MNHLTKAHIGINLLDQTSQSYYLSLANKYFDYIHAGLPVLTMDFPEYRSLNQEFETAILVPDLEVNSLIASIKLIQDNVLLNQRITDNCQLAKSHWNWNVESKKLLSIFDF